MSRFISLFILGCVIAIMDRYVECQQTPRRYNQGVAVALQLTSHV